MDSGFEGAEKLLEIWFKPTDSNSDKPGLFQVPRSQWEEMLTLVKCTIIGFASNGYLDSYLLSESSMFVSPFRLVLKTCGTTTLLLCLDKLVEISRSVGLSVVDQFFYTRKSFMYPERQKFPHTNWDDEVKHIEKNFPNGSAYIVGKTNGNHWYCYLWGEGHANRIHECTESKDYTLEILMTQLHPDNERLFSRESGYTSEGKAIITEKLQSLYEDIQIDDFMFDPCGYSCNAIHPTKGCNYFTVHVTPENHCSYASFETNIAPSNKCSHKQLVLKVLDVFRPSKFTVTLFAEKELFDDEVINELPYQDIGTGFQVEGFKVVDRIMYEFEHYDLAFYHFASITK